MSRKTTLLSECGCSLVLVEELDANGAVLSTSYEVIDVDGNVKPYSSKDEARAAYANRVYEAEQRLSISSSPSMGM
ncbi:hypothetical protein [Vibrio sp. B183]|uniref:hypothetical protein n=1 Tax=Vibrio sp. B183 TaxID=1526762 RepID=UPI000B27C717|nr:hypothetical protein [Vibrio sp. B183]